MDYDEEDDMCYASADYGMEERRELACLEACEDDE